MHQPAMSIGAPVVVRSWMGLRPELLPFVAARRRGGGSLAKRVRRRGGSIDGRRSCGDDPCPAAA
ncbi:MAG: hypothetical protein ACO307_13300, partial [Ilumatobacteraceae bacterium]